MSKIRLTMNDVRNIVAESVHRIIKETEGDSQYAVMPDEIFDDMMKAVKGYTLYLESDEGGFETEGDTWGDKYSFDFCGDYKCKAEYSPAEFNFSDGFDITQIRVDVCSIVTVCDDEENCTTYKLTDEQCRCVEKELEYNCEITEDYERDLRNWLDDYNW